ncbi:MAG: heavy metal translocating P-type ATPase [Verrucomicrobiota bacterium]
MKLNLGQSSERQAVVCTTQDAACDDLDVKLSRSWLKIAIAVVFAGQGMVFSLAVNMTPPPFGSLPYFILHGGLIFSALVVILFLGAPLFRSTWGMLGARRLSIEGLFTLSLLGALTGSLYSTMTGNGSVYYEVVAVVIAIYTFGRMLGERSQAKLLLESQRLRESFDHALVLDDLGMSTRMPLSEVTVGSRVQVNPGMPFTVDGAILAGKGYVKETALTGEPLPVVKHRGERVRAGAWSIDGVYEVEVLATEGTRELDDILNRVEDASGRPSVMQHQADELMQGFLPFVAGVSIATAIYWAFMGTWSQAVLNSMAVLLVACPCALGLAAPVAIWQGLFRLGQMGLVSRDGLLIDALARTRAIFFDKTGTLSESEMAVVECAVVEEALGETTREELLSAVAAMEADLDHPVARALKCYLEAPLPHTAVDAVELVPGEGVSAIWNDQRLQLGEASLAGLSGEAVTQLVAESGLMERVGKAIYAFLDAQCVAIFVLREQARPAMAETLKALNALEIETVVLTGDPDPQMSMPLGMKVHAGLSAADKTDRVIDVKNAGKSPLFIGDGINDASAMQHAAASISMGSGTQFTRSAASGQLVHDSLDLLPRAVVLARAIYRRLRGNLIYAACYNLVGMLLAAMGLLHPLAAALIMLCSSFGVTAVSLRAASSD